MSPLQAQDVRRRMVDMATSWHVIGKDNPVLPLQKQVRTILKTSSPKGNDAHLRAIIHSEKKWKHQFFGRLSAANSVVRGRIWANFKLIQALMYVIITCKYEKDLIKNNQKKVATPFFKLLHYQLPWKPEVGSGRISYSSKLLCMTSLPASMKRIR